METTNENQLKNHISAGTSYNKGWNIMWATFIELVVVTLVYGVVQIPAAAGWQFHHGTVEAVGVLLGMFAMAYGVLLAGPIGYSVDWVFLKAVRKEKIEIKDMFSVFERNYWNAVLASLVTFVIIGIGLIMLIVPGIIFACRLAFVPYLVIDRNMEAMEALKTSWEMTKGHGWKVFLIGLLGFFIVIAGLIVIFFGVIISIMWISTAMAVLYHDVSTQHAQVQVSS
jgi:uncharacterized membrane protein